MPFFSRSAHKNETIKHKEFVKTYALLQNTERDLYVSLTTS